MKEFLGRLLLIFIGFALILLAGKSYALMFTGTETTGHIYDIKVRETSDANDSLNIKTEVTQYYTYTVGGHEYNGINTINFSDSDRKKKGGLYLYKQLDDLRNARTLKIRYLPFYPNLSASSDQTTPNLKTICLNALLLLFAFFLIVLAFSQSKNSKTEKEKQAKIQKTSVEPQTNQKNPQPQAQTAAPNADRSAIHFCPSCGNKVSGGKFCVNCGTKL